MKKPAPRRKRPVDERDHASIRRRKNPAAPEEVIADYPIKRWMLRRRESGTLQPFHTVTVRLHEGQYLAVIDIDQSIRCKARTQVDAEAAVLQAFERSIAQARAQNPVDDDERDHQLIQRGLRQKGRPLEDVLRDLNL